MSKSIRMWWIPLGLVVLALALRLYGIGWGLPQVYEEAYPFKKAWDMWGWGKQAHFTLNPHFFNYPTFFFYVQFIGQGLLYLVLKITGAVHSTLDYRVLYTLDKTQFYLLGRTFSALFGAGTVFATFALGRRIGGLAVAAPAALLVALNQMHIAKSQFIEVDVPLTFFATLCAYYAVRILEQPSPRHYVLAGLCAGLATSTKYSGVLLPLTILVAHLLSMRGARVVPAARRGAEETGRAKVVSRLTKAAPAATGAPSWLWLAAAGGVFVLSLFLTSPYILLDHKSFWLGFNYERLHMRIGHFGLDNTPAILFYLRVMTGSLLGWPLSILGAAGLVYEVALRRRPWAIVLAVFPVVYLVLISRFNMKADRYILPLMPIAALFAAAFLADLAPRLRAWHRWLPATATAVLVAAMAAPSLAAYYRDLDRLGADTRTLSRQWIESNVPAGSFILSETYGPEPMTIIDFKSLDADVRERIEKERPNTKIYALLGMPMYQVMPEATSLFYDLRLYDDVADFIVTSSSVGSRYRKNPQLFAAQIAFYDELDKRYKKEREFGAADGSGPRITIYRNPRQQIPFAQRTNVPPPPQPAVVQDILPGSYGGFFERFGFNYEAYGFLDPAVAIYAMGLRYPDQPAEVRRGLTLGAMRCSLRSGRGEQALAFLDDAEKSAKNPSDAAFWRNLRARLTAPAPQAPPPAPTP